MPTGLLPTADLESTTTTDPQAVTEAFLAALASGDQERWASLVDDEIVYTNVGLVTVRSRGDVEKALAVFDRPGAAFEVYLHSISADGPIVLTERTDVLVFGRFRMQFWVWGRFDVHDGRITLWRDSFDFLDLAKGAVRGLLAMAYPGLQTKPPTDLGAAPGR
jgi:limonene-1,2-epoxide hydrolase